MKMYELEVYTAGGLVHLTQTDDEGVIHHITLSPEQCGYVMDWINGAASMLQAEKDE